MGISVMVDLETFGVGRKAMPISIGAVKLDKTGILDRFHVGIKPETCEQAGLKMNASTIMWWLDAERADAWKAWCDLEKVSITEALTGFALWCKQDEPGSPVETIWGNGATFDNVILRDAYDLCGYEYPVEFWQDRCYRSVKSLRPDIKLERIGTHHSALDDAESQALHLIKLCEALGVEL